MDTFEKKVFKIIYNLHSYLHNLWVLVNRKFFLSITIRVQYFNRKTQNDTAKEVISFLEIFKITYIIWM